MNIMVVNSKDAMYVSLECIKGYAFKMVAPRGKSACMTGTSALTRDNCARFDRITYLSPFDTVS